MSRHNRKSDKPLKVHPHIVDLNVHNYKIKSKSQTFTEDELSNSLQMSAAFNFSSLVIEIHLFPRNDTEWKLKSIAGLYDFHKISISQQEFTEVESASVRKERVFLLNVYRISRHVLMKKFMIKVLYELVGGDKQVFDSKFSFEVPYFQRETRLQFKFLDQYFAEPKIKALYDANFKVELRMPEDLQELAKEIGQFNRKMSTGNSMQMIKYAMNIEDLSSQDELKDYTLKRVKIQDFNGSFAFVVQRSRLPHAFEEMSIYVAPMPEDLDDNNNDVKPEKTDGFFYAQIEKYSDNRIWFEKRLPPQPSRDKLYQVQFIPNRISFRACLQAIDNLTKNSLAAFFDDFEVPPEYTQSKKDPNVTDFDWFNRDVAGNEEQKTAIKNIVNCSSFPFPYVVFGPPGTGKTSCLVECIAQIVTEKENSKILVTAQSNSACDEIGERLLKFVSRNKIFRFYSPSLLNPNASDVSEILRETSNIRGKESQMPTKEEFMSFSVVIVTLMTCSRLVQLSGVEINRHFNYIFIDEAGAATQPETYVPIVGLGTSYREITSNIVLFGDHKQLGPVILNDVAERLGLGESLLERIMTKRRYLMRDGDRTFDETYVTQLLDNFRSHQGILQFSNVLFYGGKLRAKVAEPDKSLGCRWKYLKNHKFPVVFHCVKTPSEIAHNGTSSFNDGEVKQVRFYVDLLLRKGIDGEKILEEDIGIVSPYKAQLNKLRDEFRMEAKVEIGTTEYYQGREKKIIVVSTVKSGDTVGFLKSEKRLNVCFTRAKSLLIVIGNGDTLKQNSMWRSFIQFCSTNGGCSGEKFSLYPMTPEEKNVQSELNSIFDEASKNFQAELTPSDIHKKELIERMKSIRKRH